MNQLTEATPVGPNGPLQVHKNTMSRKQEEPVRKHTRRATMHVPHHDHFLAGRATGLMRLF
jgi:hypothetical protein